MSGPQTAPPTTLQHGKARLDTVMREYGLQQSLGATLRDAFRSTFQTSREFRTGLELRFLAHSLCDQMRRQKSACAASLRDVTRPYLIFGEHSIAPRDAFFTSVLHLEVAGSSQGRTSKGRGRSATVTR